MSSINKTQASISFNTCASNFYPEGPRFIILTKYYAFIVVFITRTKEPVIVSIFQCQARPNITGTSQYRFFSEM